MLQLSEQDNLLDDRRDALRQQCKVEWVTVEHPDAGTVQVKVLDISRKGLRLLMPVCIPCGDEILVFPPQGMELPTLRAQIVRQRLMLQGEARWFECGVHVTDSGNWSKHAWFLTLRVSDAA